MSPSLRIALRYLFSRKSHNAVNVISLVAMGGVAVATAAMVCVLSVFNGFSDLAAGRLSLLDPELEVRGEPGAKTFDTTRAMALLASMPEVAEVAPVLREQGLVRVGEAQAQVELWGVGPEWAEVTDVGRVIIDGEHFRPGGMLPPATLSVGTAVDLGARPSGASIMEVWTPRRHARVNPANPLAAFAADTLRVTAVWQVNQPELDKGIVAVPIERLRLMLGREPQEATALAVRLRRGADPADVQKQLAEAGVRSLTRMEQHATAYRMIKVEKWISTLMLALIVAIASFNIVSTLSMLILEKRDSVFILRAMGAGRRMVNAVFVLEGWLVSLAGALAGLLLGSALSLAQQWFGLIRLAGDPSQLSVTAYPARLSALDLPVVFAVAAVTGLAAGLLTLAVRKEPGLKAA